MENTGARWYRRHADSQSARRNNATVHFVWLCALRISVVGLPDRTSSNRPVFVGHRHTSPHGSAFGRGTCPLWISCQDLNGHDAVPKSRAFVMVSEAKPSSLSGRMLDRRVASLLAMTVFR